MVLIEKREEHNLPYYALLCRYWAIVEKDDPELTRAEITTHSDGSISITRVYEKHIK